MLIQSHSRWLAGVLLVSLLANIIFAIRLQFPQAWHQWRMAMIPAPQLTAEDRTRGPTDASTTVIVYTNYQCPYCARLNAELIALGAKLNFRWAYRHSVDQNQELAFKAAIAAECAGDQGRFWEYNDQVFAAGQTLNEESLHRIAEQLQLNMAGFAQCISAEKYKNRLLIAKQQAEDKKIYATPTYFINGKRHTGLKPNTELEQLIADANTKS